MSRKPKKHLSFMVWDEGRNRYIHHPACGTTGAAKQYLNAHTPEETTCGLCRSLLRRFGYSAPPLSPETR